MKVSVAAAIAAGLLVSDSAHDAAAGLLVPRGPGPAAWTNDFSPITPADWNYSRAAHLIERSGFGATPEEIERLAALTPKQVVDWLVDYESIDDSDLEAVRRITASGIPGWIRFRRAAPRRSASRARRASALA